MLNSKIKITLLISLVSFMFLPLISQAQAGILPACALSKQVGKDLCGLCDIIQTAILIFKYILGVVGGSALVMFIWHGFQMLISGGNKEKVSTAQKGMLHTIIGLLIVLFSWFIINFIIVVSTANDTSIINTGSFFSKSWNICPK